jgi:hypothetical protein
MHTGKETSLKKKKKMMMHAPARFPFCTFLEPPKEKILIRRTCNMLARPQAKGSLSAFYGCWCGRGAVTDQAHQ